MENDKKICEFCGKEFIPNSKKQIYCCKNCANRAYEKRCEQDPDAKERMKKYERDYQQKKRDMERKKRLRKIAVRVSKAPSIEVAVKFLDKQINRLNK